MVLANDVPIIWLDVYIVQDRKYHAFKRNFQTTLERATAVPPDAVI
jgi:hypothetical protein